MMNHMSQYDASDEMLSEPFVIFHTQNEDGSISVRADREVTKAGEQIFEAYGDTDNSLYLESFGFVPDDNPHCAIIPPEDIPLYKGIEATFKRVGLSEMPEVCIYSDGTIASAEGRDLPLHRQIQLRGRWNDAGTLLSSRVRKEYSKIASITLGVKK